RGEPDGGRRGQSRDALLLVELEDRPGAHEAEAGQQPLDHAGQPRLVETGLPWDDDEQRRTQRDQHVRPHPRFLAHPLPGAPPRPTGGPPPGLSPTQSPDPKNPRQPLATSCPFLIPSKQTLRLLSPLPTARGAPESAGAFPMLTWFFGAVSGIILLYRRPLI